MAAGRETPVGARSDVTFDVKIDIPGMRQRLIFSWIRRVCLI